LGCAEDFPSYPETCFHSVLEEHRNSVIGFLYRLVEDETVAEELAQEVFLRASRTLAGCTLPTRFITGLFRSAVRLACTWLRDVGSAGGHEILGLNSPEIEVRRALAALSTSQRAAVLMHKYARFDYSQIAHVLSCSDSAAKSQLERAYAALRAQLTGVGAPVRQPVLY